MTQVKVMGPFPQRFVTTVRAWHTYQNRTYSPPINFKIPQTEALLSKEKSNKAQKRT